MDADNHERQKRGFFASGINIVFIGFLAIAGYFLVTEHRAHIATVFPYLPFLLVLACPLLHIFMHGSHGAHGGSGDAESGSSNGRQNTPPHRH